MQTALLTKPAFAGVRVASRTASVRPRGAVRVFAAANRPVWLPGIEVPPHLKGEMPGDSGFDPLGLGAADADRLKWYQEAEKTNGRWAMAAVVGILVTELLGKPKWFEAGAEEYWMPSGPLLAVEFLIMGFFELKRYNGWVETKTSGFVNSFPFDPLNQNSKDNAVKEVKNGRLAMVAFVGFAVQALVTRQGPIEALVSHLSSPFSNNIGTNIGTCVIPSSVDVEGIRIPLTCLWPGHA